MSMKGQTSQLETNGSKHLNSYRPAVLGNIKVKLKLLSKASSVEIKIKPLQLRYEKFSWKILVIWFEKLIKLFRSPSTF